MVASRGSASELPAGSAPPLGEPPLSPRKVVAHRRGAVVGWFAGRRAAVVMVVLAATAIVISGSAATAAPPVQVGPADVAVRCGLSAGTPLPASGLCTDTFGTGSVAVEDSTLVLRSGPAAGEFPENSAMFFSSELRGSALTDLTTWTLDAQVQSDSGAVPQAAIFFDPAGGEHFSIADGGLFAVWVPRGDALATDGTPARLSPTGTGTGAWAVTSHPEVTFTSYADLAAAYPGASLGSIGIVQALLDYAALTTTLSSITLNDQTTTFAKPTIPGPDPTSTELNVSPNAGVGVAGVLLYAKVPELGATGTVTFTRGETAIAGCEARPVNTLAAFGFATCVTTFPTPGPTPVTAAYDGDTTHSPSAVTQTVEVTANPDLFQLLLGAFIAFAHNFHLFGL